eukprot:COSAG02_NODE_452_length_22047_cov_20.154502_6_plen_48_part_00
MYGFNGGYVDKPRGEVATAPVTFAKKHHVTGAKVLLTGSRSGYTFSQ